MTIPTKEADMAEKARLPAAIGSLICSTLAGIAERSVGGTAVECDIEKRLPAIRKALVKECLAVLAQTATDA